MTFTCGGAPMRAAPQTNSGNVVSEPELKYVTTKSSIEIAKHSSSAARIAGAISGSVTFRKVDPLVRAEVHRRLLEVAVEADESRLHRHDREADAEHDVRDQDRPEAEDDVQVEEERQQRRAEHDLRRRQRQEDQDVRGPAAPEAVADERQRDQRPERRRDEAREQRDLEREEDGAPDPRHAVPVAPVVPGEALPDVVELARSGWLNEKTITTAIGSIR